MKKILISLLIIYGISRFCHHQTAGFRMSKIQDNTFPVEQYVLPKIELPQKFIYLGRGLQSFSFISEDQAMVLKIFNNRYQNRLFWLNHLPFFFQEKIALAKQKLARNFNSYKIAFEDLQTETGLLYFHPTQTDYLHQRVILVDNLGIEHEVNLDKTGFLLQKKAILFYPYIKHLMEQHDLEKAQKALGAFVEFLKHRYEKGIGDNDQLVRANFGFLEEAIPMQIDVGPFYKDETLKNPDLYKNQLLESTLSLKHWLEAHYPELAIYLNEVIKSL